MLELGDGLLEVGDARGRLRQHAVLRGGGGGGGVLSVCCVMPNPSTHAHKSGRKLKPKQCMRLEPMESRRARWRQL